MLVPFRVIAMPRRGDITLLVQLSAGSRFEIETHPYEEEMYILRGRGYFREEGIIRPYGPDDIIVVPARTEHAFAQVSEETVLVKHVPDLYAAAA